MKIMRDGVEIEIAPEDEHTVRPDKGADQLKIEAKAEIAARRYQEETKGITVNGSQIKTDPHSQMKMIGAALAATIDPTKSRKWKAGNGFIQINAATTIAVAQAVDAHVQACFDREAVLVAAVENGTYTADMLNQGWP